MPPKRPNPSVSLTDLENAMEQMELRATERQAETVNLINQVTERIGELSRFVRDQFATLVVPGGDQQPRLRPAIPVGDRIPKPRDVYGKAGFMRFLADNLPDQAEQHADIYKSMSDAALLSVQTLRNEHQELAETNWGNLGVDFRAEMATNALEVVLQEQESLEIIRRCPDLWPCLLCIQPKWTQIVSYRRNRRAQRRNEQQQ